MPATAKTLTEEDLRPDVESLLDEIINGDDSHWQRFAAQIAAEQVAGFKLGLFHTWSANNRLSLAAQVHRRGTQVHGLYAGVVQWRKRDRVVREGEKPYFIFGPPSYVVRKPTAAQLAAAQANPPAAQQGANVPAQPDVVVRGYRRPPAIEVYDYTQTVSTQEDWVEPDWSVPLAGGDLATLAQLTSVSPVPVKFVDLASKLEHGWLDSTGITVDDSRTPAEQIFTLAHELGHYHLGHLDEMASTRGTLQNDVRATCEQEAALVQWLVMKMLGLDEGAGINVTAAAGQYLRRWTKNNPDGTTTEIAGHRGKRKLVKNHMDTAWKAARTIVNAYAQADIHQAATAA